MVGSKAPDHPALFSSQESATLATRDYDYQGKCVDLRNTVAIQPLQ
jgi:hypothetical protein